MPIHWPPNNSQPSSHWLLFKVTIHNPHPTWFPHYCRKAVLALLRFTFFFLCLLVGINPKKLYSASCVGKEVNPMGVITHGQRAYQRQQYIPCTCQSMVNTLQVDGLARISGLTTALYKAHPQPPNGVPPCLV